MKLFNRTTILWVSMVLALFSASATFAQSTKTIVIDANGTGDYTTIRAAFQSINGATISQPHVFRIKAGWYDEWCELKDVSGTSSTNTISVESYSGDSADVWITNDTTNIFGQRGIFDLQKVSYVTVKNLSFQGPLQEGTIVGILNDVDHVTFKTCHFRHNYNSSRDNFGITPLVDFTLTDTKSEYLLVEDCHFEDLVGVSDGYSIINFHHLTLKGNTFEWNYSSQPNPLYNGTDILIEDNLYNYAVMGVMNGAEMVIRNNRAVAQNMILSMAGQGVRKMPNRVYNNFFIGDGSSCLNIYGNQSEVYFNSFNVINPSTYEPIVYIQGSADSVTLKNNNFKIDGNNGVVFLNFDTLLPANFTCDYNNYYTPNGGHIYAELNPLVGYQTLTSLTDFQTEHSGDRNSITVDPFYASNGDLHAANGDLREKGTPIAGIVEDIDGDVRDTLKPCIGADEITASVNLSVVSYDTLIGTFYPGNFVEVRYTVENKGGLDWQNGSWKDEVYISTDQSLSADDKLLATLDNSFAVKSGNSYQERTSFRVPILSTGNYYIIIKTNGEKLAFEKDFSDNTRASSSLFMPIGNFPDLEVTEVQVPPSIFSGKEFDLTWKVTNTGSQKTNVTWKDNIYVATDASALSDASILDSDSLIKYRINAPKALGPGESYTNKATIRIPVRFSGNLFYRVQTNPDTSVFEQNIQFSTNGKTSVALNVQQTPLPDLQPISLGIQNTAFSGEKVPVNWSVKNTGNLRTFRNKSYNSLLGTFAPMWTDHILVSKKKVFSHTDETLVYKTGSVRDFGEELDPDSTYTVLDSILFDRCEFGTYYVYVLTNVGFSNFELSYSNNFQLLDSISLILEPNPDLKPKSLLVNNTPSSGKDIDISFEVENDGFADKGGFHVDQVYLHKSPTYDKQSAIYLGNYTNSDSVKKGNAYNHRDTFQIPYDFFGPAYVTLITDASDAHCEAPNEDNNILTVGPLNVDLSDQPDLKPEFVQVPDTVSAGEVVQVITKVENNGNADVLQSSWLNYLTLYGPDVERLETFRHFTVLQSGGSYSDTLSVQIPLRSQEGDYTLDLHTDPLSQVYEHNAEGNNITSANLFVRRDNSRVPDLTLSNVSTMKSPTAGDVIEIEYTLTNLSKSTAKSGWKDLLVLRDKNGKTIETFEVNHLGRLQNGASITRKHQIKLPYDFAGEAELELVSNHANDPIEYVRTNNSQKVSLDIQTYLPPDMVVNSVLSTECCTFYAQQKDTLQVEIENLGLGSIPTNYNIIVALSQDEVSDRFDPVIGVYKASAGQSANSTRTLSIPVKYPNYANGSYRFVVRLDTKDTIYEGSGESNNTYVAAYTVTLNNEPTNLVLDSIQIKNHTSSSDNFITIDYYASKPLDDDINRKFQIGVVLSKTGSLVQGFEDNVDLAPVSYMQRIPAGQASFNGSFPLFLPPSTTPGKWKIIVVLDEDNVVLETNEADNQAVSKELVLDFTTELTLDVLKEDNFTEQAFNQRKYYKVNRPNGKGMIVKLDMDDDKSRTEVYQKVGTIPSNLEYDNKYDRPNLADQEVLVPVVSTDTTDYIQVVANYTPPIIDFLLDPKNRLIDPSPFDIICESAEYSVYKVTPNKGSVYGNTSVKVEGFDFRENTIVHLVQGTDTITAFENYFESSSKMSVVFDFRGFSTGVYDVFAETNGKWTRLEDAFTLTDEVDDMVEPWVELNYTPIELTTVYSTLNVNFGNYGYMDGYDYWLVVGISTGKHELKYLDTKFIGSDREEDIEALMQREGIDHPNPPNDSAFVDIDGIRYYAFWLPKLSAKDQQTFTFKINSSEEDAVYINTVLFPKSTSFFSATGRFEDLGSSETMQEINFYLKQELGRLNKGGGFDCNNIDMNKVHKEILQETWKVAKRSSPQTMSLDKITRDGFNNWKDNFKGLDLRKTGKAEAKNTIKNIFKEREKPVTEHISDGWKKFIGTYEPQKAAETVFIPKIPFEDLTKNVFDCIDTDELKKTQKDCVSLHTIGQGKNAVQSYEPGGNNCKVKTAGGETAGDQVNSKDPNEIIGPAGVTDLRFIDKEDVLDYTIYFENVSTASAPAIEVTIDNPLDSFFRLQNFGITEIGFGDTSFSFNGENRINTLIPLGEKYNNMALRVVAGLNTREGSTFWQLTTIDPTTGNQVNNPFGGFLPPNDSTGRGQGYVKYTIKADPSVPSGYELKNFADIIFDQNEIISTNVWSNILTDGTPESKVFELPAFSPEEFLVTWSGTDGRNGPGIRGYRIYVSENDENYREWISFSTDTSAMFLGEENKTYRFYSIVILNDGTVEVAPITEDAITQVKSSYISEVNIENTVRVYPNPGNNELFIEGGTMEIEIINLHGTVCLTKQGEGKLKLDVSNLSRGMYFIRVYDGSEMAVVRWIKR
jgi:hypothetical protein